MYGREIVALPDDQIEGRREIVDWDRLDAEGQVVTHRNIPIVYIRRSSKAEYLEQNQNAPKEGLDGWFFWEVSID